MPRSHGTQPGGPAGVNRRRRAGEFYVNTAVLDRPTTLCERRKAIYLLTYH